MSLDNQENIQTSVKVAVRIRPLISREQTESCGTCFRLEPDKPQIWLGKDKAFTYDHVFGPDSKQSDVYDTCVKSLVEGCFSGYNATVFAYGQTGSGKTYSMGIGFEPDCDLTPTNESLGIVPRAVYNLFEGIERKKLEASEKKQLPPEFKVKAQFIELYNEEIIDLLDDVHFSCNSKNIRIQGENGTISLTGVTTKEISSVEEAFECLRIGSQARTTASTQMNSHSSRSHAIFTLTLDQTRVACESHDVETLAAKFHFVDLAGSERLKKTGATGERAKEAISINSGLLCLGNVISALDKSRKTNHVPYRNSKLTRLLQDSLGGNSRTLMIACIAPTDRDYMESLSTLRYANRAKNIENKIVVNQDTSSHIIASLKRQVRELKAELMELKQGKRVIGDDGAEYLNDVYCENSMLLNEIQTLRSRNKALQEANDKLANRQAISVAEDASPEVKQFMQKYFIGVKIGKLQKEVCDLKKQKVIVMNKLKEEANKLRNSELQNSKRIAQLTKQERLKDVKVKNLELENARLRATLKRRDAEVKNLKNETKNLTARNYKSQQQLLGNNNPKLQQQQRTVQPRRWNREPQYVVLNGVGPRKYWNSNYNANHNSNTHNNVNHNNTSNGTSITSNSTTNNSNKQLDDQHSKSNNPAMTQSHHHYHHRRYDTFTKRKNENLLDITKDEFYSNNNYNRDRNRRLSRTPQELYYSLQQNSSARFHS